MKSTATESAGSKEVAEERFSGLGPELSDPKMIQESSISDNELVRHAVSGCQDAVREIILRYEGRLMGFITRRGNHAADSEDILQETFIASFDRLHTFDTSRSFSAWIFGIARNKANEHLRKVLRLAKLHANAKEDEVDEHTPEQSLDAVEQSRLFWGRAERLLKEVQFTSLWLRYQEDLDISEIADALNRSEGTIKVTLFRARKALHDHLQKTQATPTP